MSAFCLIVTACGPRISINIFRQSAYYHILHATQPRLWLILDFSARRKINASQYYISAWSNLFRHMLRRSLCNDYYHCGSYISLLSLSFSFLLLFLFFHIISPLRDPVAGYDRPIVSLLPSLVIHYHTISFVLCLRQRDANGACARYALPFAATSTRGRT